MRPELVTALHIFVIVIISLFVILSVLAAAGKFDHWTTRFIRRYIFRRKPREVTQAPKDYNPDTPETYKDSYIERHNNPE